MEKETRNIVLGIFGALFLVFGLIGAFCSYEIVDPGYRGVYVFLGNADSMTIDEGFHWKNPLAKIVEIPVKQALFEQHVDAVSQDLQEVKTSIAVNYHPDYSRVSDLYKDIGSEPGNWETVLIAPRVQEVTKATTAKFTVEGLISKRAEAKAEIKDGIIKILLNEGITVIDVSITNFDFNEAFARAVEQKQVAEQDSLRAKNELDKARIDSQKEVAIAESDKSARTLRAEARAIEITSIAEAEAKAQERMNSAITPATLRWRYLEKWDGHLPKVIGGGNTSLLLPIEDMPTDSEKKK